MSSIAGFYQCFKQKRAFIHAIEKYRENYPTENLFIVNDKGDESLEEIAKQYNANYHYRDSIGYTFWYDKQFKMGISIIEKPLEWLSRIYEAILIYKEDFFINLEDDVWVMNKVNIDDLKYDINGCHLDGGFNNTISNYIRKRNPNISKTYIGGFGGCIFRTLFFKEILKDKDVIKKDLEIYYKLNGTIAADAIISFLTYIYGGTIGTFPGYSEIRDNDYKKKLDENKIEILHDYKELYESKEMRDNTINLVTPYNSDMAKKIMICYKNKYYK